MKIAFVSYGYPDKNNTAKFAFSHEEMSEFSAQGVDVDVFDFNADPALFQTITADDFPPLTVFRFPDLRTNKIFKFLHRKLILTARLKELLKDKQYDLVIYSFINFNYSIFHKIFKKHSSATSVFAEGVDAMIEWDKPLTRFLKKRFLSSLDHIFARSDFPNALLKHVLKVSEFPKMKMIYNGINRSKFEGLTSTSRKKLLTELGLPDKKILLSVCQLIPRKGIDVTLRADALLKKQGIDFLHVIVGRGFEKPRLEQMVKDLKLSKNVKFIEYIEKSEDLMKYYAVCDIYQMVSKTLYQPVLAAEGFGIVYAESGYLGKPVIGGNSGGVPGVVKHGFTGYLVDPDAEDVHEQVAYYAIKLLTDDNLYKQISKNAQYYINETFDWSKSVQYFRKFISQIKK